MPTMRVTPTNSRPKLATRPNAVAQSPDGSAPGVEAAVKEKVKALTNRFPIYQ